MGWRGDCGLSLDTAEYTKNVVSNSLLLVNSILWEKTQF